MRDQGWIMPADQGFGDYARNRAAGAEPPSGNPPNAPDRREPRPLAQIMAGAGDPTDPADVVRFWLATRSWDDSFEVLRTGTQILVTQAGLDAVNSQASGTDRAAHAAILMLVASGFPIPKVQELVTEPQALIDLVMRALANKDQAMVARALALNPGLARSPLGIALSMAGQLATGQGAEQLLASAAPMRDADPGRATEVAGLLTQIASAMPDGTLRATELADLVAALGGDWPPETAAGLRSPR